MRHELKKLMKTNPLLTFLVWKTEKVFMKLNDFKTLNLSDIAKLLLLCGITRFSVSLRVDSRGFLSDNRDVWRYSRPWDTPDVMTRFPHTSDGLRWSWRRRTRSRRVYAVSTTTRAQMRFLATQNGQRKLGKGSRAQTEKGFKRHLVSVKVRCSDSRRQWLMCLYLPDDDVVSNTTSARHGRYILCSIFSSRERNKLFVAVSWVLQWVGIAVKLFFDVQSRVGRHTSSNQELAYQDYSWVNI